MNFIYVHSIPYAQIRGAGTQVVFQATVECKDGLFVNRTIDSKTGRTHERYFDSLEEFTNWHSATVASKASPLSRPFFMEPFL